MHRPSASSRLVRRVLSTLLALAATAGIASGAVVDLRAGSPAGAPVVYAGRAPIGVDADKRAGIGHRGDPPPSTGPATAPSGEAPREAAQPAVVGPDLDALRGALDRARWAYGIYGVQYAVATSGGDWTVASGVARDGQTPLTPEAPSAVGSATKTFVAAIVLELAHEGRLKLDDRVRAHLPDLPIPGGVTVRQLLSHTSGLADLFGPLQAKLTADPAHVYTPAEVLAAAGPAWFGAGAGFAYSNTNYVILGLLVEKVTGTPMSEVLAQRIFEPLGLASAGLGDGIGADGRPILQPAWATSFWTSGAITATARDLARWGAELYGGRVLDPSSLAAMTTFTPDDYGLGSQRLHLDGVVAYGHSGLLSTYTSLLVYFPRQQVTVAILANRAEIDLASLLLYRDAGLPSLLDLSLTAAPRR